MAQQVYNAVPEDKALSLDKQEYTRQCYKYIFQRNWNELKKLLEDLSTHFNGSSAFDFAKKLLGTILIKKENIEDKNAFEIIDKLGLILGSNPDAVNFFDRENFFKHFSDGLLFYAATENWNELTKLLNTFNGIADEENFIYLLDVSSPLMLIIKKNINDPAINNIIKELYLLHTETYNDVYLSIIYLACEQENFENAKALVGNNEKKLTRKLMKNDKKLLQLTQNTGILNTDVLVSKTKNTIKKATQQKDAGPSQPALFSPDFGHLSAVKTPDIFPDQQLHAGPQVCTEQVYNDAGVSVSKIEKNNEGNTCLHVAAIENDLSVFNSGPIKPRLFWTTNKDKKIPLQLAVAKKNWDIALLLIDDMLWDHDDSQVRPVWKETLFIAIANSQPQLIKALLRSNYKYLSDDINSANKKDATPLYLAVKKGNSKIAKYLLEAGAKMGPQIKIKPTYSKENNIVEGDTLLHLAIRQADEKMVQTLLEASIDKEQVAAALACKNKDKLTPLELAVLLMVKKTEKAQNSLLSILKLLCEFIDKQCISYDFNQLLLSAIRCNNEAAVDYLLTRKVSLEKYSDPETGDTLLHEAVKTANLKLVKTIYETESIPITAKNKKNITPLAQALQLKNLEISKFLLRTYNVLTTDTAISAGLWKLTGDNLPDLKETLAQYCLKDIKNYCIDHSWQIKGLGGEKYVGPEKTIKVPQHVKLILAVIDGSAQNNEQKLFAIKKILLEVNTSVKRVNFWRTAGTKEQYQFINSRLEQLLGPSPTVTVKFGQK